MKILNVFCALAIIALASLSYIWISEMFQSYRWKFNLRHFDYRNEIRNIQYKRMTDSEWSEYVRSFEPPREHPDCEGEVLVEINGVELLLPRKGFEPNGSIEVNHAYRKINQPLPKGSRRVYQYFLHRPNPNYSCSQKNLIDVKSISIAHPTSHIYRLGFGSPTASGLGTRNNVFEEKWAAKHLGGTHTKTTDRGQIIFDENGEKIEIDNSLSYESFNNGVTRALVNDRDIFYKIPLAGFSENSQPYTIATCYEKKCRTSFIYKNSIAISYVVAHTEDFAKEILRHHREVINFVNGLVSRFKPIIVTECYNEFPLSEECQRFREEQSLRESLLMSKIGFK